MAADAQPVAGDAREEAMQWIIVRKPADVLSDHRCALRSVSVRGRPIGETVAG
jgi:hypothetical protein